MGGGDAEQKRLLLACRTERGKLGLAEMGNGEIGTVRPRKPSAGRSVAAAALGESGGKRIAGIHPALEGEAGARERPFGLIGQPVGERRDRLTPGGVDHRPVLGHLRFERAQVLTYNSVSIWPVCNGQYSATGFCHPFSAAKAFVPKWIGTK